MCEANIYFKEKGKEEIILGQIQDKLIDIGSMILKTGILDNKTKALIGLSTAVAAYCAHCHGQSKSIAKKFVEFTQFFPWPKPGL